MDQIHPQETKQMFLRAASGRPASFSIQNEETFALQSASDRPVSMMVTNKESFALMKPVEKISLVIYVTCMITNFVIMKLCSNPDGTFSFNWMNLMSVTCTLMAVYAYKKSKQPFKIVTKSFFALQFLTALCSLISNYILNPQGIALTSVPFAVAMTFTFHPFSAIFRALFFCKFSSEGNLFLIGSVSIQILAYVLYVALYTDSFNMKGFLVLLASGLVQGVQVIIPSLFLGQGSGIDLWDKTFWFSICAAISAYAMIPLESYISQGTFNLSDMVPFHNFGMLSVGLIIFYAVSNTTSFILLAYDATMTVAAALTGIVSSSLLSGIVAAFLGFDWVGFVMGVAIYLNAVSYAFSYPHALEYERLKTTLANLSSEELSDALSEEL